MVSRIVLIIACLLASIVCFAMGLHGGIVVFVLLGVLFEMIFWLSLTKRSSAS
ncbi:hypothetical protein [Alteromonas sp. H39]|uniref:hypothetical protein n=1 Tax=Alteromonas sp. H39 TaxID=3389876 RepID=UPI0039E1CFDE